MIRAPRSDFWQAGIIRASIETFATTEAPFRSEIAWLPDPGPWRYLADPFGLQYGDGVHVFVEAYDYRTKHGVIEHHEFSASLAWRRSATVLKSPVHLSYPFIVRDQGEIFMIPESHRANEVALYRAAPFPGAWMRETTLMSGLPVAEASVLSHEGRWWMFYTLVGPHTRDQRELHVACAPRLTGPWQPCAGNPVLNDLRGARPGGTPFIGPEGRVVLPVQDCRMTYGGAIRFVEFLRLEPAKIEVRHLKPRLTGGQFSPTHTEGCHTLSQCGNLTLVDTKRIVRSWGRHGINLQRKLGRLFKSS